MKRKIMALLRKTQSSLTVKMNKSPLITTLLLLLLVNIVILIASGIVSFLVAPEVFPNVFSALSTGSLKWMFSSNSLNYIEGKNYALYIVAGVTVIVGMVLTSGTIIALTTNALKDFFTKKTRAKGKLILQNHIVILNWNNKVADILIDLMHKEAVPTVLILSDKEKDFVQDQLKSALTNTNIKKKSRINLIVRQGDPFSRRDLDDICIDQAKSIAIMALDAHLSHAITEINRTDLNALRLLLVVGGATKQADANIIVEVDTAESVNILNDLALTVESLKNKTVSILSFNKKLGQILAQTVLQESIFDVLTTILSFEGDEIYSTDACSIEEYLALYTDSIPVLVDKKMHALARARSDLGKKREKPYSTERRLTLVQTSAESQPISLFIIGTNQRLPYMLENLEQGDADKITIHTYKKEDNEGLIRDLLAEKGISKVLILSDDTVPKAYYDANVFLSLVELRKHFSKDSLSVITEVLDTRNSESMADFGVSSAIVSNHMISLLITQLLEDKDSKNLLENLLLLNKEGSGGIDLQVSLVGDVLDINQDLTFQSSAELVNAFYYSTDKQYMLLAIKEKDHYTFLNNNMDKKQKITLDKNTQLVCIKYK